MRAKKSGKENKATKSDPVTSNPTKIGHVNLKSINASISLPSSTLTPLKPSQTKIWSQKLCKNFPPIQIVQLGK